MTIEVAILISRFAVMAVATFFAIIVWSLVRDAAWMMIVVGIIAAYGDILYSLFLELGLFSPQGLLANILNLVFPNLPWIFFSIAFIIMIGRKKK